MMSNGLPPLLVMGDDDLLPVKSIEQIEDMKSILLEEFGMVIHPDKTYHSMFLQKFTDESLDTGQYWTPFPRIVSKFF